MLTKNLSTYGNRVYTRGNPLNRSEAKAPEDLEDDCIRVLLGKTGKKADRIIHAKKLNEILWKTLESRTLERNISLAKEISEAYEYNYKFPKVRLLLILCASHINHKDSTKFLTDIYNDPDTKAELKEAAIEALEIKGHFFLGKIKEDEIKKDKKNHQRYENGITKIKNFFLEHSIKIELEEELG